MNQGCQIKQAWKKISTLINPLFDKFASKVSSILNSIKIKALKGVIFVRRQTLRKKIKSIILS